VSLLQTIRPLDQAIASCARSVKGGPGIPAIHDGCSHLPRSRGCRPVAGSMPSRAGRVGTLRLVQLFSSCRKGAARSSSAHRTRPWPQCRSQRGRSAVRESRKFVFIRTVRLRDGWRPTRTASGPLLLNGRGPNSTFARHNSENTQYSITHAQPSSSTDAEESLLPAPERRARRGARGQSRGVIRPTRGARGRNKTKNKTNLARRWGN